MILEEETFEKFGYYPSDLKSGSHKHILVACDKCGKIRQNPKRNYFPFCKSCAPKSKPRPYKHSKHTEETKQKMSRAHEGLRKYLQLNNKNWLYDKYWVEELSMESIRKILGCSLNSVWYAMKKHSIPRRTLSEAHNGIRAPCSTETKKKIGDANRKLTPAQRRINHAMSRDIRRSLQGMKNKRHWETIVGYPLTDLMQTLEKEFRQGMTWNNYGKWHLDHMIPLARFVFHSVDDSEFKKAWSLDNLQPLWADENFKKRDRFIFF
jgi:hypothetical protein